jgi:hypothetical protein
MLRPVVVGTEGAGKRLCSWREEEKDIMRTAAPCTDLVGILCQLCGCECARISNVIIIEGSLNERSIDDRCLHLPSTELIY